MDAVARVLRPDRVFNHNMETRPRRYRARAAAADYRQSLDMLEFARRHAPEAAIRFHGRAGQGPEITGCCAICAAGTDVRPSAIHSHAAPFRGGAFIDLRSSTRIANTAFRSASRWCLAAPGAQLVHSRLVARGDGRWRTGLNWVRTGLNWVLALLSAAP
jgi:hypothetical protein